LLEIIVAQPRELASRAVLPNGSSHLDGTTAISDLLNILKFFYDLKNLILYVLDDLYK
jgi:hypothetical protein